MSTAENVLGLEFMFSKALTIYTHYQNTVDLFIFVGPNFMN